MLSCRVDRDAGTDVTARMMLNDIGGGLGGVKTDGLNIPLDINVFVGSDMPAECPIDGEIVPYIDIVVNNDGDLAKAGAQ